MKLVYHLLTLLLLFSCVLPILAGAVSPAASQYLLYIGTYTKSPKSKGIYAYRFDSATGKATPLGLAAATENPSYVAFDPSGTHLYAVNEISSGRVSAFRIDMQSGKLSPVNWAPSAGADPCHLSMDKAGKVLFVANYSSGTIAAIPILPDGGVSNLGAMQVIQHRGKGPNPQRQEGPHAHWIGPSPDNRFVLSSDLGLDDVLVYRFDPAGQRSMLTPNAPPAGKVKPGSGPRHVAFHPSGRYAYVISEMGNTITTMAWNAAQGSLTELQSVSTLPADFKGQNTTAEVRVHPSGKFVYGSNRGHDSIAVFAVDPSKGTLTFVEDVKSGGREPRGFNIDPGGKFLVAANQNSDSVVIFRIDPKTGRLTPTGDKFEVGTPVDVEFLAAK